MNEEENIVSNKKLNSKTLKRIAETGEPKYSSLEAKFLRKYAPCTFGEKDMAELSEDAITRREANQKVFDSLAKLDVSVARANDLPVLAQRKTERVNEVASAFDVAPVALDGDIQTIWQVKVKALEVLAQTTDLENAMFSKKIDTYPTWSLQKEKAEITCVPVSEGQYVFCQSGRRPEGSRCRGVN